ncbi:hypothetical protein A1OO_14515 [Enterovibrio norvegicus FF-33]|uniref:Na+-dependent transporter n=1 Tax=Enterovibrio norvegicus FF-454 TaxID=1185651 RepID=A0A1E5CC77_9GAMM|nr:hypothetical protein [Enterovibrio norvegicus]OEE63089.1 hypothetical protein A1OK_20935 [Enterovibrio norvegicus FF-454]OEE66975.1 hypothetical protein A1OO_14515 [Enterovibrio norvegicus FF-33]OEE75284.1 hypothetical protein A1OQ_07260 [Enterovibrio norvegicus FF-162]
MLFTLIGINQRALVQALFNRSAWIYALVHGGVTTLVVSSIALLFGASTELLMAATAVCATGSLFATPAIVRSVGFDPLAAMAFTLSSTLMMPVILYINLAVFSGDEFSLDLQSYCLRLAVFIIGPMVISYLIHQYVPQKHLSRIHGKLAQFTILLVFSFPFGLTGQYRTLWNDDRSFAITMFFMAFAICILFFIIGLALYWRKGREAAYVAAITSGNRNVLLTYSVAGAFLGPLYLPLVGALQFPIFLQPIVVRYLLRRGDRKAQKEGLNRR